MNSPNNPSLVKLYETARVSPWPGVGVISYQATCANHITNKRLTWIISVESTNRFLDYVYGYRLIY